MSCSTTLSQLAEVICAKRVNLSEAELTNFLIGVQTDTRMLKPNEVFVALRGEKFDGHKFVEQAIAPWCNCGNCGL